MKKYLFIYILLFCGISASYAQQVLTLDDCKELALKNNYAIKKAHLGVEEAQSGKNKAFTSYFPTVNATGIGLMSNSGLLETSLAGMDLSLIKEGVFGGITLMQPVFAGGQIVNANKLAGKMVDFRENESLIIADEVELATEQYYWQYIQLKAKLKTIQTVEELVNQTLKEVSLSVQAGLITHNNELQVKLKLDEVKAGKIELENSAEAVKLLMSQHIGLPADSTIIAEIIFDEEQHPASFFTNVESALLDNKTYNLLDKGTEITRYQTRMEKGKLLPTVAVGANYLFENMVDKSHTIAMAYVSVSIPISGLWGGSHSVKQKKINEKISEYAKIDAGEKIMVQMKNHYKELEVSFRQIQIARQSVENAQENVRLNTNYYQSGLVTLTDLLDAQTLFQKANDTLTDRHTAYLIKLSQYKKLTGQ